MSHGRNNFIIGSDDEEVDLSKIVWMFSNVKCEKLHHKPKMIFIQACRGGKVLLICFRKKSKKSLNLFLDYSDYFDYNDYDDYTDMVNHGY